MRFTFTTNGQHQGENDIDANRYTFFVLKRIMGGECNLLLSDHERLILCFTGHPFPVWIWTSDDAAEEDNLTTAFAFQNPLSFLIKEEASYCG